MKKLTFLVLMVLGLIAGKAQAANTGRGALFVELPSSVSVSSTTAGAAGQGLVFTSTPTAGTYSTGLNVYVTHLRIEMYATGTLTGSTTPVKCTSTNLPGSPTWLIPTGQAIGTLYVIDEAHTASPLQATAGNTAVQINCPGTASTLWNVKIDYFIDN